VASEAFCFINELILKLFTELLGYCDEHRYLFLMTSSKYALLFCDETSFQYFVEAGAIAVRRVRKEDLRHVAKATGATMVCTFSSCCRLDGYDQTVFYNAYSFEFHS
jgi:predicted anti-sigma-YlaC factor YlaD